MIIMPLTLLKDVECQSRLDFLSDVKSLDVRLHIVLEALPEGVVVPVLDDSKVEGCAFELRHLL